MDFACRTLPTLMLFEQMLKALASQGTVKKTHTWGCKGAPAKPPSVFSFLQGRQLQQSLETVPAGATVAKLEDICLQAAHLCCVPGNFAWGCHAT